MKTQTWLPVPVKEPRTLADVESSREKPVLVWWNNACVLPAYVNEHGMVKAIPKVGNQFLGDAPEDHFLYSAPSRPTKLEDVPDRRVIYAGVVDKDVGVVAGDVALWFSDNEEWWISQNGGFFDLIRCAEPDQNNWQLTDHCVELVETEIGVVE